MRARVIEAARALPPKHCIWNGVLMNTLNLLLLAVTVAVATPSTMEVPVAPSPFQPVPLLESVTPDGQSGIAGKEKDKDKNKKDRSGKAFTKRQKDVVKERNAKENDGKIRCVNCNVETVAGKRHRKGVTPPSNEAHVDHKLAKSKGGAGEVDNGQVLCRKCNLKKGNKHSCDGKSK